jgi:hypothetical protein
MAASRSSCRSSSYANSAARSRPCSPGPAAWPELGVLILKGGACWRLGRVSLVAGRPEVAAAGTADT